MSDTRLMTYAEIVEALGIGGDSARALVRRKRWHRKPGNDGCTRVEVPIEYLNRHDGADSPPAGLPAELPASTPLASPLISPLISPQAGRSCSASNALSGRWNPSGPNATKSE